MFSPTMLSNTDKNHNLDNTSLITSKLSCFNYTVYLSLLLTFSKPRGTNG